MSALRTLVIVAHPDDAEFGAGGTLASWTDSGIEVSLLVVTRGDQGGHGAEDLATISERRAEEQRAASERLGVTDVRFLDGYRDGWVQPTFDLQRDIVRVIRDVRPSRIVTQSPERNWRHLYRSHPDHMAVGEATVRATYPAAENPHAWPELITDEGLAPHKVHELWLSGHPNPNHAVDISDFIDAKIAALECHASQVGGMAEGVLRTSVRKAAQDEAERCGLRAGALAESFLRVVVNPA